MNAPHDDTNAARRPPDGGGPTRSRLQALVTLPPLPRRSHELLQLLTDPDLNILRLVEVVEETPALAARILGVANSPFFRSPLPVRSISDAIIRLLGLNLVRDLSLSFILTQPFDVRRCRRFDPLRYWKHAVMSANLAQVLAPLVREDEPPHPSEAYLAGLLHSLGLLALVHVAPEGMGLVFEEAGARPERSLSAIEQELLGLDHTIAGGDVATIWHLPPAIAAAMRHHRDAGYRGDHWPLVAVVSLADGASRACLQNLVPEGSPTVLATLGIPEVVWSRAVEQWRKRIVNIEALASLLARPRS